MRLAVRIRSDFSREINCRSLKPMDIKAKVQQHRNNLLGIEPSSDTELVDRTTLAMYPETERLTRTDQFVSHVIEGIGTENHCHSLLNGTFSDCLVRSYANFSHKVAGLLVRHAGNLHARNHHRFGIDVNRPAVVKFRAERTYQCLQAVELVDLSQCCLIAPVNDSTDAPVVEAHHRKLIQTRLDGHVRNPHILLIRLPAEHVHTLGNDISKVIEAGIITETGRKVHTNDNVRAHGLRNIGRIVVPHTSVHQHHSVSLHRSKYSRYRHCRTQCRIKFALIPDFRLGSNHFSSHAHERDRQFLERHIVLITYCKRTEYIIHILSESKAGRQTAEQIIPHDSSGILTLGRAKMNLVIFPFSTGILDILLHALHIVLLGIIEREREKNLLLVLACSV